MKINTCLGSQHLHGAWVVDVAGFRGNSVINPFQSKFSANPILPSSYLFWAGKRLVDYWLLSYSFKREKHRETERVQPALSVG
jgi:hypothetical protein